jgi:hypothetical protein
MERGIEPAGEGTGGAIGEPAAWGSPLNTKCAALGRAEAVIVHKICRDLSLSTPLVAVTHVKHFGTIDARRNILLKRAKNCLFGGIF